VDRRLSVLEAGFRVTRLAEAQVRHRVVEGVVVAVVKPRAGCCGHTGAGVSLGGEDHRAELLQPPAAGARLSAALTAAPLGQPAT
jgi:hypothetical protein